MPTALGIPVLIGIRNRLRAENLFDTETTKPTQSQAKAPVSVGGPSRTTDGTFNDLSNPAMGSVGSRFGRNVPPEYAYPEKPPKLFTPNPRTVSLELLTRTKFQPATSVNALVAAWLQFEVHDWFHHGVNEQDQPLEIDLTDDDPWHERPMRVQRTRRDKTWSGEGPETFVTADSHWWDSSQIYGSDPEFAKKVRAFEDGKVRMGPDGLRPADLDEGLDFRGVAGSFWLGLDLLHTVFMLEHNSICDALKKEYPTWSDEQLFVKARLINAALMAKIHTVEWTPAVIAHPTTIRAMHANWYGIAGKKVKRKVGRIGKGEVFSGIPGSPADHHGVPYSLTEEFVSVYRMHPLIPDDYTFRSIATDEVIEERTFNELTALHSRERLQSIGIEHAFYSLGIAHPGAIVLHNNPKFLQRFERPDGTVMDLAATDILRVRERGVPRYNQFRRLFHTNAPRTFEELTTNPVWAEEIRKVYDNEIEMVDLMVGLYSEPLPKGFAFSDTAFRVFILMASRRLKSDRFFTDDYRPEVYTQLGLDWIDDTTMISLLLRHYPQLEPALRGLDNAFVPWNRTART
ncbi:MAG TPA: peroxidase family protein [Actinomycetota bacterium]|nr:peroxidase family protein [Actinomycetota bacterium]